MLKRISAFLASCLLSSASLLVLAPAMVHAAVDTCTWTGGGSDDNFSTAANWTGCDNGNVPENGDSLVFGNASVSTFQAPTNDISNLVVESISIPGTNADNYTITGSGITVNSGISASAAVSFKLDIKLGATQTFSTGSYVTFGDSSAPTPNTIDLNGNSLVFAGSGNYNVNSSIIGTGNIGVSGVGTDIELFKTNTWTGTLAMQTGTYATIYQITGLGNTSNSITVASDSRLSFCAFNNGTVTQNISLAGAGGAYGAALISSPVCGRGGPPSGFQASASVKLAGTVTLTSNTVVSSDGEITISGPLTGSYGISLKSGDYGKLTINSSANTSNTPNGTTEAVSKTTTYSDDQPGQSISVGNKETAVVDGKRGTTFVNKGGTLKGHGTVGNVTIADGGTIAPGNSPGCLNSGNLTFVSGSTYDFEVGGPTVCTEYDQTKVTGTVDLGNGTLNTILYNGFKPVKGQSYTIIDNDAADAVNGTFNNLAEGATFIVSGYVFKVSYIGGDGNDVVLSVQSVPSTPDTGFQLLSSHPIITLMTTTLLAAGIALLGRRYRVATNR